MVVSAVVFRNLRPPWVLDTMTSARCGHITYNVFVPDSIDVTTWATVHFQSPETPTCVMSPSRSFSTFLILASDLLFSFESRAAIAPSSELEATSCPLTGMERLAVGQDWRKTQKGAHTVPLPWRRLWRGPRWKF